MQRGSDRVGEEERQQGQTLRLGTSLEFAGAAEAGPKDVSRAISEVDIQFDARVAGRRSRTARLVIPVSIIGDTLTDLL